MPGDHTNTHRLTRAGGVAAATAATGALPLVSLLARTRRMVDLLPQLHQHAIETTGGSGSLLFEVNPRNGVLQATSGFGLDSLRTDTWIPAPGEATLVSDAFSRNAPTLVIDADRQMPDLAERIGTDTVLLLPLAQGSDRIGLLVIGYADPPDDTGGADATAVADAFLAAIELSRHRQRDDLQTDLRALLDEFWESLSSTLTLSAGLDIFCHGANRLFGADRTSVWIHERRAHELILQASSDPEHLVRGVRVSTEDPQAPAAAAMRRARAEIAAGSDEGVTSTVTVPLRGTRRALGTIVFDGVRVEPGGEIDLLDRADELGRQLSSAVENLQLLDEVTRSRRELENTFDSISHLIVVADRRGHVAHANRAFARRTGRTREQLIDRPLTEFIGPELAGWLARNDEMVRPRGEAAATCEVIDPILKGPFMVTTTDLLDHEGERVGSVIVARDLTPQTRLETEREELRHRLTQSEKLAALGQFVAGIAHELNNPLQGVLGHLELLRVTGAIPKNLRTEIRTVYREADRAAKIVRNLLVFAGSRRTIIRRPVSLNAVLQKVLALRAEACRAADIELVRHYDEKLPRVESDPLLLHQVFLNMVLNAEHALQSVGGGGRISLTTAAVGDRIVATVQDTGPGISADALPRIFEPFYTTKEVGKGTGLGLAIAYGIVQEHGGHISASNHPGGGALFTVELPAARRRTSVK